jgi:hypothetical protein
MFPFFKVRKGREGKRKEGEKDILMIYPLFTGL